MAYSKKERQEYNTYRERVANKLGIDKNKYNALRRVAQSLHRADEDSAMGRADWKHNKNHTASTKEYTEKDYNKDVSKAFSKTKKFKGKVSFHHQTDPRGNTLYASTKRIKNQSDSEAIY